jgi:hypothetical protein
MPIINYQFTIINSQLPTSAEAATATTAAATAA